MKPTLLCLALLLAAVVSPAQLSADSRKPSAGIAAVLLPYVEADTLAGAVVLVADKDKVLTLEAVGYSDVAAKTPLKTDALVWIASMSKPVTAAALMILVDEGKVNLDDPVEKYLPEFKAVVVAVPRKGDAPLLQKPSRPIIVRDLLRHTSGMPFKSAAETPTLDALHLKDAVESYAKTPLMYEPGTKYQYSNAGINTAGRIIEVVSKTPYEEFLDKRLFAPLGMTDTTFWPSEEQMKRLAKSYQPGPEKKGLVETKIGQLRYPLTDRTRGPMPAGGLFSTAADMGRFGQMLLNGGTAGGKQVLSEAAVKEMTTRQTGEGIKESYGLGFSVSGDTFGHGGAFATNLSVDKKRGLVLVWHVQHAGFPGDGGKSQGAFRKAAEDRFGTAGK
ncbi:MAG: estB 3 [Gemmataceae bacterium]|nr:estB 3 [Gemmataceae bacterium]